MMRYVLHVLFFLTIVYYCITVLLKCVFLDKQGNRGRFYGSLQTRNQAGNKKAINCLQRSKCFFRSPLLWYFFYFSSAWRGDFMVVAGCSRALVSERDCWGFWKSEAHISATEPGANGLTGAQHTGSDRPCNKTHTPDLGSNTCVFSIESVK